MFIYSEVVDPSALLEVLEEMGLAGKPEVTKYAVRK